MRNKKHMTLNLDKPEAMDVLFRLLEDTDIIIEGFRPGVVKRLGIDYESLKNKFVRLIYCSITGYGQNSPYRHMAGHDINYLGFGGLLRLNTRMNEPPVIPPIQIADLAAGGMCAAIAILSALFDRERTAEGRYIDISMLDGIVAMLHYPLSIQDHTKKNPIPGSDILTGRYACYQVYKAKDGRYVSIGALEPRIWERLCEALHCSKYSGKQFAEGKMREEILAFFRKMFLMKTRDEWFELLKDRDVCVGKVLELDEVWEDEHTRLRGMNLNWPLPNGGVRQLLGNPIKMSGFNMELRLAPASWGEHTEEILCELGYSGEMIQELRAKGAI